MLRTLLLVFATVTLAALEPGVYKGRWEGQQSGGSIRLEWVKDAARVSFTYDGQEVPCKTVRATVEGNKVEIVYQFALGGYTLQSTIQGATDGKAVKGTYRTQTATGGESVDSGTWQASAE